ncbi:neutrophil antibiotic peptide NP-3A-like [Fukomys damarensis]|uniref:neutrophil antibiotic peptide NP-3A-like n=1 Tax=Fukomys damarensis TaxID=885580 RepID=UPI0008FF2FDA|nr:neutrophil antibiotic peptide NP-3A-like [Fukomys damarensis]
MRTLALLAAILLLALQAQAEPLPGRANLADEEEQVAVIFPGEESSALQDAGVWRSEACHCRAFCFPWERSNGSCRRFIFRLRRCCR